MSNTFNPKEVAESLRSLGYHCVIDGNVVIAQTPVHASAGTAAGRFVEFKAVTLREEKDVTRLLLEMN